MEISLQLGNPQVLLPELLCCCPQGREAVTRLAWSQEAGMGMGAENHSTFSIPKGPNLLVQLSQCRNLFTTSLTAFSTPPVVGNSLSQLAAPLQLLTNSICYDFHLDSELIICLHPFYPLVLILP